MTWASALAAAVLVAALTAGAAPIAVPGLRTLRGRVLVASALLLLLAAVACGDLVAPLRRTLAAIPLLPLASLYLGLLAAVLLHRTGVSGVRLRAQGAAGRRPPVEVAVAIALLPLVLSLPCGHALGMASFATGPLAGLPAMESVPLAAAFARTAYGSCAPASAGGIARMADAWAEGGSEAIRAAQLFALLIAAGATAAYARALARGGEVPNPKSQIPIDSQLPISDIQNTSPAPSPALPLPVTLAPATGPSPAPAADPSPVPSGSSAAAAPTPVANPFPAPTGPSAAPVPTSCSPWVGRLALAVWGATLLAAAHADVRRIEPLTWLAVGAGLLSLVAAFGARVAPSESLGAVPAGPLIDILLGFVLAGAAEAAGAFDLLGRGLVSAATLAFPGPEGALLLVGLLPLLLPLGCGRIAAAALVPFAGSLGPHGAGLLSAQGTAACLAMLTLCAAMSCVVSPAGGCLALLGDPRRAAMRPALDLAALGTAGPLTAAYLRWRDAPVALLFAAALVVALHLAVLRLAFAPGAIRGRAAAIGVAVVAGALTASFACDPSLAGAARGAAVGALAGWTLAEARR